MGHVACIKRRNTSGISFRKPGGKRNLGKLMDSWKGNIKMLIKETW